MQSCETGFRRVPSHLFDRITFSKKNKLFDRCRKAVAEADIDACNCDPQKFRRNGTKAIHVYGRPHWWQVLDFVLKSCDQAVSSCQMDRQSWLTWQVSCLLQGKLDLTLP
jgi:hypothetical protein